MLQDGIVNRYLDDHCPDEKLKLCPYRAELPRNADAWFWGNPVFIKLGRFAGLGDEMGRIVLEGTGLADSAQIREAYLGGGDEQH